MIEGILCVIVCCQLINTVMNLWHCCLDGRAKRAMIRHLQLVDKRMAQALAAASNAIEPGDEWKNN